MTVEYVLLLVIGGVFFMGTLMKAPKYAFEEGGTRLATRVEVQLATGTKFKPYKGASGGAANGNGTIPWHEKE